MNGYLVIDVSSAPLPDAERYLEGTVRAPSNYRDEQKIAEYVAEKQAERLKMAATDVDLACITGIATIDSLSTDGPVVMLANENDEADMLRALNLAMRNAKLVTFGGFNFDLPLVMRRARYLDVPFPRLDLDRYRSPHIDLCELLSDRNPQRRRSLQFYAKRMQWTDIAKPLSGEEEAQVLQSERWEDLADSLIHDVTATYRLAQWAGVIPAGTKEAAA